jgi:putative DNA primase/helicase
LPDIFTEERQTNSGFGSLRESSIESGIKGVSKPRQTPKRAKLLQMAVFEAGGAGSPPVRTRTLDFLGGKFRIRKPTLTNRSIGMEAEQSRRAQPAGRPHRRTVQFRPGACIEPEAVRWLWPQWLARGKLHILAGAPGTGKTTLALALAALVSAGGRWPDGEAIEPANVLIWSGEDDVADTLLPRVLAAGGNAECVRFIEAADEAGETVPFDPASDIGELVEAALRVPRLRLLILDPVVAAIGGATRQKAGTRHGLQRLVDLAAALDCAVLGITHFSKNSRGAAPLDRVMGSVAYGAMARFVLATVKPADPALAHRLVCAKANLAGDRGGLEYRLVRADVPGHPFCAQIVEWGQPLEGSAHELMAIEQADEDATMLAKAVCFLAELLADGPVLTWRVEAAAKAHGYSRRTLQRAKAKVSAQAVKIGFGGGRWAWQLPGPSS